MSTTTKTIAKRSSSAAARVASPLRGYTVRVMTAQERVADIKDFGREIRKSKESAVAFLQSAGILDQTGELAEPFRA
jgi:hypothetical protein